MFQLPKITVYNCSNSWKLPSASAAAFLFSVSSDWQEIPRELQSSELLCTSTVLLLHSLLVLYCKQDSERAQENKIVRSFKICCPEPLIHRLSVIIFREFHSSNGAFGNFDRARHCEKSFLCQALLLLFRAAFVRLSRAIHIATKETCQTCQTCRTCRTCRDLPQQAVSIQACTNGTGVNHRHVCQCFTTFTPTFKAGSSMKHACSLWSLA